MYLGCSVPGFPMVPLYYKRKEARKTSQGNNKAGGECVQCSVTVWEEGTCWCWPKPLQFQLRIELIVILGFVCQWFSMFPLEGIEGSGCMVQQPEDALWDFGVLRLLFSIQVDKNDLLSE